MNVNYGRQSPNLPPGERRLRSTYATLYAIAFARDRQTTLRDDGESYRRRSSWGNSMASRKTKIKNSEIVLHTFVPSACI